VIAERERNLHHLNLAERLPLRQVCNRRDAAAGNQRDSHTWSASADAFSMAALAQECRRRRVVIALCKLAGRASRQSTRLLFWSYPRDFVRTMTASTQNVPQTTASQKKKYKLDQQINLFKKFYFY
jgi:hypothetical protein